jgi:hypothetical protein
MPSDAQSTRGVTVLLRPSCGCFGRIGDQRVTARTVAAVVIAALAVFILGNAAQTPKVARPAAGAAGWARDLGPVELTVVVPSTPAELARLPGAPTPFAHADPFGRATIQVVGHTPAAVLLGVRRPAYRARVVGRSSGLTSTSRALEPSDGPTTPRDSSRSMRRPALAKPTRSLRCSIEVDPNWVVTTSSVACSSRSRSSPMSSSTCFLAPR